MKDEKGFSLASVLVAGSILSIIALGVMQMFDQLKIYQQTSSNFQDENAFIQDLQSTLYRSRYCRISIAGEGAEGSPSTPIKFKKEENDQPDEGIEFEVFLSDTSGTLRSKKKYSSSDSTANSFRRLKILQIKLVMNNGTGMKNRTKFRHF